MSKATLGQKSLGLTARLLIGTGLVLLLTQSLEEVGMAGKSLAELRQQSWTQQVMAGKTLDFNAPDRPVSGLNSRNAFASASRSARFTGSSVKAGNDAVIQIAKVDAATAATDQAATSTSLISGEGPSATMIHIDDLHESIQVNSASKRDRRRAWGWEPFKVAHGRKRIALNWSGSLWTMDGPFGKQTDIALPKLAFAPYDDLAMVMADASHFALPDPIATAPESMVASNDVTDPTDPMAANPALASSSDGKALAYAPTSVEAMEEPFKAILTEQRTGRISEDNQVVILDAVDALNNALDEKERAVQVEEQVASIDPLATLNALPQARVPSAAPSLSASKDAPVSQPLDISPIVASIEKKQTETRAAARQQEREPEVGLTMQKSQERRAELKLASLSGEPEEKEKKKSRWASWFSFGSSKKAKIDAKGEHAWVTNKVPKSSFTKKQKTCLANAIYFESRSEPEEGQIAVAQVVMNRVKNPAYPNTICGVVYQNKNMRNACQFSFACDNIPDRIRSKKAWNLATKLADEVINEEVWLKKVGSSTHYHATYVNPKWAHTMKKRDKIGLHVFYKTYGGGWS